MRTGLARSPAAWMLTGELAGRPVESEEINDCRSPSQRRGVPRRMTDQGRPRPARMSAYATASSHLALLSDLALERVVDQAPQVSRGSAARLRPWKPGACGSSSNRSR